MHCFQNLVWDLFRHISSSIIIQLCANKIAIEFALVYEHKDLANNLGHLLLSLQSMKGIRIGN